MAEHRARAGNIQTFISSYKPSPDLKILKKFNQQRFGLDGSKKLGIIICLDATLQLWLRDQQLPLDLTGQKVGSGSPVALRVTRDGLGLQAGFTTMSYIKYPRLCYAGQKLYSSMIIILNRERKGLL